MDASTPPGGNDWAQHRLFVVNELTALREGQGSISEQLVMMRIDVAMLKVRSGLWGAAAGLIPARERLALLGGAGRGSSPPRYTSPGCWPSS